MSKIKGVCLEAPPRPVEHQAMAEVKQINADWVAIIPYAFSKANQPDVFFEHQGWWGERVEGVKKCIDLAHQKGLRVMVKPHVWVRGQGWPGEYRLKSEADWIKWESNYRAYILTYARVAEEHQAEMLCIATEFRHAVRQRPLFWSRLIKEIRTIYDGQLTYAANWDNFHRVTFWDQLDYIGIDAYFPMSTDKNPSIEAFQNGWRSLSDSLEAFSEQKGRKILFTEYGFKSIDYVSAGHWNYREDTLRANMTNQSSAYEGLYRSVWQEDWLAGGFLWKWHMHHAEAGGSTNKRYTPQNKPAQAVIAKWYNASKIAD